MVVISGTSGSGSSPDRGHCVAFLGNEEYKGRNRHNVECFLERVLYFGWPNQPSSGTMENFASGRVFM